MKLLKHYKRTTQCLAIGFALFSGVHCTKDFQEINTNPVLVTKDVIKPSLLLTPVLKNSIFDIPDMYGIGEYSGYFSPPDGGDVFLNLNWDDPFGGTYRNYLINIAEIIRLTTDQPLLSNENAIARIWKAWLFHQLTDQYGDIPYFGAVTGVDSLINQPKYDKQQDIYVDLFKELKEAAAQLSDDPDQESFGDADILFHGDVDSWIRFANSLRLRLALRVSYVDPSLAQINISDVLSQPLIEDNSQNATLSTIDDGNTANDNQFYEKNLRQPGNMVVSFTLTDNLKKLNDPRLPAFAKPAPVAAAGYRGVPIQLADLQKVRYTGDSVSLMSEAFLQKVYDIVVINAAEVDFLRSEAALQGLTTENAQAFYAKGIQDAMDQYHIDPSQTTAYLASSAGVLTGTDEEKLEQIITQKWLATLYNSEQGWAEFRRTGYPTIWTGAMLGSTNGEVPRRLIYSNDEYFKNTDNVKAAAASLSQGDSYTSRLWWDIKQGLPFHHPRQGMFPPEDD